MGMVIVYYACCFYCCLQYILYNAIKTESILNLFSGVTGIFISLVVGVTFTLYFLNISKPGLESDLSSEEMSSIYGRQSQ